MSTYQDYMYKLHKAKLEKDPNYILEIPADELTYELCCVAVKKAAGVLQFFQFILKNYPQYIDENLCKIAVDGTPRGECVREEIEPIDMPEGDWYETVEILQYPDPILKYVPENFRTADVCRVAVTHDWRSLEFVPVMVKLTAPDICESAVNNCDKMMGTDVIYYGTGENKKDKAFSWLGNSVFETNPDIFNGEYTLKYTSYKWKLANKDKVVELLSKRPSQIKFLSKKFGRQAFDVIRRVVKQEPDIICYLSKNEQKLLYDLIKEHLVNGCINLGDVCAPVQMLMPEVCVAKLTSDPNETRYLTKSWANGPTPGLNLDYLCKQLQEKNVELISKLVCEQIELLECVKKPVLRVHPEICEAVIEKYGAVAFDKIPKWCFTKHPYLYEKLLQKCPEILPELPKRYQNRVAWRNALEKAPWLIKGAPVNYITEADCIRAFSLHGSNIFLSSVPPKFRTYNVCKIALETYTGNIEYVPEQVKEAHFDICLMVVEKKAANIQYVPESIQLEHLQICKRAVTDDPMTLKDVKPSVQCKYPEICRLAIAQLKTDYETSICFGRAEQIKAGTKKLYTFISSDVLKTHWDYINNATGDVVITVVGKHHGRYR